MLCFSAELLDFRFKKSVKDYFISLWYMTSHVSLEMNPILSSRYMKEKNWWNMYKYNFFNALAIFTFTIYLVSYFTNKELWIIR